MKRIGTFLFGLVCFSLLPFTSVRAQTNSYKQTNLQSSPAKSGITAHLDSNLPHSRFICTGTSPALWIAESNGEGGVSVLSDKTGEVKRTFSMALPVGRAIPVTPTACAANIGDGFHLAGGSSQLIFVSEDGTISGWTGGPLSILAVDNSAIPSAGSGAVYKGAVIVSNAMGRFLLATNFRSSKVEIYDSSFQRTQILGPGAFEDAALPAIPAGSSSPGYAPFGVQIMTVGGNSMVAVTYALQDTTMHNTLNIPGSGFVDLFAIDGTLIRRVTGDAHLNAPWGVTVAPATFGFFAGDLLVGNLGDGTISAFNFATGAFIDEMRDPSGAVLANASLKDVVFAPAGMGIDSRSMLITTGPSGGSGSLMATLSPAATPEVTADFSLGASPTSMTIAAGQSANFTITVTSMNSFTAAVSLTCSGQPLNSTCSLSPASVTPASGGMATSTLTIKTNSNPYHPYTNALLLPRNPTGRRYGMLLPIPVLALWGVFLVRSWRKGCHDGTKRMFSPVVSFGILVAAGLLWGASGCGYNSNGSMSGTQRGSATVMITGTSGSLVHSTSVSLTVQ